MDLFLSIICFIYFHYDYIFILKLVLTVKDRKGHAKILSWLCSERLSIIVLLSLLFVVIILSLLLVILLIIIVIVIIIFIWLLFIITWLLFLIIITTDWFYYYYNNYYSYFYYYYVVLHIGAKKKFKLNWAILNSTSFHLKYCFRWWYAYIKVTPDLLYALIYFGAKVLFCLGKMC